MLLLLRAAVNNAQRRSQQSVVFFWRVEINAERSYWTGRVEAPIVRGNRNSSIHKTAVIAGLTLISILQLQTLRQLTFRANHGVNLLPCLTNIV